MLMIYYVPYALHKHKKNERNNSVAESGECQRVIGLVTEKHFTELLHYTLNVIISFTGVSCYSRTSSSAVADKLARRAASRQMAKC